MSYGAGKAYLMRKEHFFMAKTALWKAKHFADKHTVKNFVVAIKK